MNKQKRNIPKNGVFDVKLSFEGEKIVDEEFNGLDKLEGLFGTIKRKFR